MKTVSVFGAMFLIAVLFFSTGSAQASQRALQDEDRGAIHGWAFNDLDKDGIRESGEFGLAGTVICLVGYNWCDHTEWGEFEFDWLVPGTYQVELTQWPEGYFLLSPNPVTIIVQEGGVVIQVDFALSNNAAGVIRFHEIPIGAVTSQHGPQVCTLHVLHRHVKPIILFIETI